MTKRIGLCFFFLFSMARLSNAEVGNLKDVIKAAQDDIEPAYIKNWGEELSKKLNTIAQKNSLQTPRQQLTWFHTMTGIIRDTYEAFSEAALDAVDDDHRRSVREVTNEHRIAHCIVTYLGFFGASTAAYSAINGPVYEHAKIIAQNALPTETSKAVTGRIAFRVAEWAALNWLLASIELIFDNVHRSAENSLGDNSERNPFASYDALRSFMNESFGKSKKEAMYFIAPWLVQVVSPDLVPHVHQPLFIQLRLLNGMSQGHVMGSGSSMPSSQIQPHISPLGMVN